MSVTEEIIIIEDVLEKAFEQLPRFSNGGEDFYPLFKFGDDKELIAFLKENQGQKSPYPIIWLVYPFEEDHQRTHVNVENMSLVLATETNCEMFNEERFETTYKQILFPLYNNIKKLFQQANTIMTDDTYRIMKFPNYSDEGSTDSEEQKMVDIWDALKITFNAQINNRCLRTPINF